MNNNPYGEEPIGVTKHQSLGPFPRLSKYSKFEQVLSVLLGVCVAITLWPVTLAVLAYALIGWICEDKS